VLRLRTYKFILDKVTNSNLDTLSKALTVVPVITGFHYNEDSCVLAVEAASNPEDSIRLACDVAGARLRRGFR
jgi:hypothetical protein